jgi:hypothetical protein
LSAKNWHVSYECSGQFIFHASVVESDIFSARWPLRIWLSMYYIDTTVTHPVNFIIPWICCKCWQTSHLIPAWSFGHFHNYLKVCTFIFYMYSKKENVTPDKSGLFWIN